MELTRTPLEISSFPPNLQMHLKEEAPPQMKMMAARGMVPAPPAQMVQVLYQLHFDDAMSAMAVEAAQKMPENLLLSALGQDQPPAVLDWFAEVRTEPKVLETIILNKNADDATVWGLAKVASAQVCDMIANNQVRVLRSPAIIEVLYTNTNARMSTVDKLIDLAEQNGIDFTGLPGLQEALRGGLKKDGKPGLDDNLFGAILGEETRKVRNEDKEFARLDDKNLTRSEREALEKDLVGDLGDEEADEEMPQRAGNLYQQIAEMNIAQKVRLATVGSREAIMILIRDSNKLIHMAAVKSPRMRIGDVRRLSANKSLPEGVIKAMSSNRDWTRHYDVMVNLTQNPKTPLSDVLGFLNHLRPKELRDLTRNRNVSQQVSRMAKQLLQKRGR